MRRPSRRRALARWAAWASLVGIVLLAWLGVRSLSTRRVPEPASPPEPEASWAPATPFVAAPTPSAAPAERQSPKPVIDEVQVEKKSVCQGEENLVTVRAHAPDGSDAFLNVSIGGGAGASYPVKVYRAANGGAVSWPMISVFGKDDTVTRVPVPQFEVRDCKPTRTLVVTADLEQNAMSEYALNARIIETPDPKRHQAPFNPTRYKWTFGDDTSQTTTAPFVTHSYAGRPQTTMNSDFVVKVEVTDESRETLVGRTTLHLRNPSFEMRTKKVVALMFDLAPRFPTLDADGKVKQTVRVWHDDSQPVTIDHIVAMKTAMPVDGGAPADAKPELVEPATLLGSTSIPPGHDGLKIEAQLDTQKDPDVFQVTYEIRGHSADGLLVAGSFSVMRPPDPSSAKTVAVTDPLMMSKIITAQNLLHKDHVTQRELHELQIAGAFANLEPTPSSPSLK